MIPRGANELPFDFDIGELSFEFMTSPGPGGQNVNKVATACRLRFNIAASESLPQRVKSRLIALEKNRINRDGELLIVANRHRTQAANKADALERLIALLKKAATRPKTRKPTRPTAGSKLRRLHGKRVRSETKKLRGRVDLD